MRFNSIPFVSLSNAGALLSIAVYVALTVVAVLRLVKYSKDPWAFGILFFLITIALFSNIPFLVGAAMAERFAFFASAGFSLLIALAISAGLNRVRVTNADMLKNSKTWMIVAPLSIVLIWMTASRAAEWADNYTLFSSDAQKSPNDSRLHYYLGNELVTTMIETEQGLPLKMKHLTEGVASLQKAVAIYPGNGPAHEDLGHAFYMLRQFDSAEVHDRKALEIKPGNAVALSNLAGVYFTQKKYTEAIDLCKKALVTTPGNNDIVRNIAYCYQNMQQYDSAIVYYKKVIQKDPGNIFSIENIALSFKAAGNMDSARKYEATARLSEPQFRLN